MSEERTAPSPARRRRTTRLHGDVLVDEYAWLRHRDRPEVLAHLRAENAYCDSWFAPHQKLVTALNAEFLARMKEDDAAVPYRKGEWWYSTRTVKGLEYPVYERSLGNSREVVLDLNELARKRQFLQLGLMSVSPDGSRLAYSLDRTGSLEFTLEVSQLPSRSTEARRFERVDTAEWANDSATLFYSTKDEAHRPFRVWRHTFGQTELRDTLVYEERDRRFSVELSKTLDHAFVVLTSASKDSTELRVIDAHRPNSRTRLVLPRRRAREAALAHRDDQFILRINDTGPNFRIISTPAARPNLRSARVMLSHRPGVMLEHVEVFRNQMVVRERDRGLQKLLVYDFSTGRRHHIDPGVPLGSAQGRDNETFDPAAYRFSVASLTAPEAIVDYDLATRRKQVRKTMPVPGFDPGLYESRQISARAPDGRRVPISLVWRRDRFVEGTPQPLLLEGYGAYGISYNVTFSPTRLSLLDRGVIVALAHVRGGGDLGRTWYSEGKLRKKMNTFTDFIACAETLISRRLTSPRLMIAVGGSAGGLLIGAVANARPDLFKALVAEVPFLDVINTMLDESLPLTVGEFLEWGNPKRAADYRVIRAYSPYENLGRRAYPAMFLRTSLHDSLVPYWEAAKYVARLRALKTDSNEVLLSVNLEAGHSGASGRYQRLKDRAGVFAYMLVKWGLATRPHKRQV